MYKRSRSGGLAAACAPLVLLASVSCAVSSGIDDGDATVIADLDAGTELDAGIDVDATAEDDASPPNAAAALPPPPTVGPITADDDMPSLFPVAVDLVSVLVQLDGYSPYATTVQLNEPMGPGFGEDLVRALRLAGYGLQFVSGDLGRNYLAYSAATRRTERGRRADFEIGLGPLSIARSATVAEGAWVPVSPVTVSGVEPQAVSLHGSIYLTRPNRPLGYPSGVRFVEPGVEEPVAAALYRYDYRPTGTLRTAASVETPDPARFVERATAGLYEAGERAFARRPPTDFEPRQSLGMRFPTASPEWIGPDNRRALETLVGFIEPSTDRLAVASCPAGDESADDAIDRSARVKAELLTLGVPGSQVLELGCPAGDARRTSDDRPVAVTIERLVRRG